MTPKAIGNTKLEKDLSAFFHNDTKKDTVLILSEYPEDTVAIRGLIQATLPNLKMVEVRSTTEAEEKLQGETRDHVAMIVAFDGGEGKMPKLQDVPNLPIIFVSASGATALTVDQVEAVTTNLCSFPEFRATLEESINRRLGLFEQMEKDARNEVLEDFCVYNIALAKVWLDNIKSLFIHKAVEDSTIIPEILKAIKTSIDIMEDLKLHTSTVKDEDLKKIAHDLVNGISGLMALPYVIEDDDAFGEEEEKAVNTMKNEADQMNFHLQKIREAYQGLTTWQKVKLAKPTMQKQEKLEIPEGTSFCVIDDTESILALAKKTIEIAGGKAMTVNSKEALKEMLEAGEELARTGGKKPEIQVFLLDNDLGEGVRGYSLIPLIRSKYPQALIIAHTADAVSLNADQNNPYREQGVEIVGKREWRAISGVVKKMFPKKPSGVAKITGVFEI